MLKKVIKYGYAEINYRTKQLLAEKPVLYNLFWETTLKCNAKCKHCGSKAGENINFTEELSTEEIKNTFKSISQKYNANKIFIHVTGGEPLLRKDLFDVMKYAHNLGFHWGITTNGILIDNGIIKKMQDSGMTSISISIDGLEKTHNNFRCVNNAYIRTIENIKKLKDTNFYLQVTTVVSKLSLNELEDLYKVIKNLEVNSWRIVNMDPIGRANDNQNIALDSKDYKKLFEFIKDKRNTSTFNVTYGCSHFLGMKYEKEVRDNMFFCHSGYCTASILYNGDIYVCPNVERRKNLIQGNIRKDDFVTIWENGFKWFRNRNNLKCKDCENCKDWKYCQADSLHTWDFDKDRPKLCLNKILLDSR